MSFPPTLRNGSLPLWDPCLVGPADMSQITLFFFTILILLGPSLHAKLCPSNEVCLVLKYFLSLNVTYVTTHHQLHLLFLIHIRYSSCYCGQMLSSPYSCQ